MVPLAKALDRIKIPRSCRNFIVNLFKGRSMRVITEHGLSDPLTAGDGIDQGEVISPLVWRIFYDPLLSRIQQDDSFGYTMNVQWPHLSSPASNTSYASHSIRIAALAFADDTAWIANSKSNMDNIIAITNQFFLLNDIEINGAKLELLVTHSKLPRPDQTIIMGKDNTLIHSVDATDTIRYLGVWFSPKRNSNHQKCIAKDEIQKITNTIKHKKLTNAQVVYINNRILIPRLEYRLSTYLIPENQARIIFTPMTKLAKQLTQLASTAHTNIITHPGIAGIRTLWQNQLEHHAKEFTVRLNSNSWATTTTEIRLRQAQLDLKLTACILSAPIAHFLPQNLPHNLAYTILQRMKTYLYDFTLPHGSIDWNVSGPGITIRDIFLNEIHNATTEQDRSTATNMLKKYCASQSLPLFYLAQITSLDNSSLFTWQQVQRSFRNHSKGATPKWFYLLKTLLLDQPDTDLIKIELRNECYNSLTPRLPTIPISSDRRKREWISLDANNYSPIIGKITRKNTNLTMMTLEHWTLSNHLPSSIISPCPGCHLNKHTNTIHSALLHFGLIIELLLL